MNGCGHDNKTRWKALSFVSILTTALRAIVRSTEKFQVRILRPVEFELLRDAMDPSTRRICTSLLLTGMRYAELQRLRENPEWLDGKFIYLPRGSMLKVKAKQKERAIRLSDMGKTLLPDLFQVPHIPYLSCLPWIWSWDDYQKGSSRELQLATKLSGRHGNHGLCSIIQINPCRLRWVRDTPLRHSMSITLTYHLRMTIEKRWENG